MTPIPIIRRALLSVSDKTGIVELGQALQALNIEILSTGGTARALSEAGVAVVEVSAYTGFPELMEGRLKTLHPRIHGGLLGRRGVDEQAMDAHDIPPIDLLVVNLYPFHETVARQDCTLPMAVENIDIGGPAMLRAAAKNHAAVGVVVEPQDYPQLIQQLQAQGGLNDATRRSLAARAFAHTARYDGAIAAYLSGLDEEDGLPRYYTAQYHKRQTLRYGENPHQRAAFYQEPQPLGNTIAGARQLQGKALSFNNIADADAALDCVASLDAPACVIVKHANPCGVALGETLLEAYQRAFRTDPTSAFGGIIAFNRPLDASTAETLLKQQFVEVILAPSVNDDTLPLLSAKPNVRVLSLDAEPVPVATLALRSVSGGLLVQDQDHGTGATLQTVSRRQPDAATLADLRFAWQVVRAVKSNAIVYARELATVGIGAGQMSRVYSARIAALKAIDEGLQTQGAVMASDAFFPFRDSIDEAARIGIQAIIQPGGSVRDQEVIAAADEHDIAMVFTGMRHFRH